MEREQRAGRLRRGAAIAVVGVLAVAWFMTARIGNGDALAQTRDTSSARSSTTIDAVAQSRHVLPVGMQCRDQERSPARIVCTDAEAAVEIEYRRVPTRDVEAAYRTAIGDGSASRSATQGPPVCARGGEEERAWSRPATPDRVAGHYACRVETGRAAIWWSVDDDGLLAHATASNGDLRSLYAWWASHSER